MRMPSSRNLCARSHRCATSAIGCSLLSAFVGLIDATTCPDDQPTKKPRNGSNNLKIR